ncbi:MAG TPA: hypothetical protein VJQ84_05325 [Solirubrobacterales bacterium]|nr:hypothetical protein [Solirubrobacterales bacterium]
MAVAAVAAGAVEAVLVADAVWVGPPAAVPPSCPQALSVRARATNVPTVAAALSRIFVV